MLKSPCCGVEGVGYCMGGRQISAQRCRGYYKLERANSNAAIPLSVPLISSANSLLPVSPPFVPKKSGSPAVSTMWVPLKRWSVVGGVVLFLDPTSNLPPSHHAPNG